MSDYGENLPAFEAHAVSPPSLKEVFLPDAPGTDPALAHYAQTVVSHVRSESSWGSADRSPDRVELMVGMLNVAQLSADMGFRFRDQIEVDRTTVINSIDPLKAWKGLCVLMHGEPMLSPDDKQKIIDYLRSIVINPPTLEVDR